MNEEVSNNDSNNDSNNSGTMVGRTWLIFVPPSWLVIADVVAETETELIIGDCVWLERSASDKSTFGSLPFARTPSEQRQCVTRTWEMAPGTRVQRAAALMCLPCAAPAGGLVDRDVREDA